jgi:hypothetical protein
MPSIATTLRKGDYPAHMKTRPVYHVHRFDPVRGFTTEARSIGTEPPAASACDSILPGRKPALCRTGGRFAKA